MRAHRRHRPRHFVGHWLLLVASCCSASNAVAAAYRWTDAQGQVHFTQTPPANRAFTEVPAAGVGAPVLSPPTPSGPAGTETLSDNQRFLRNAAAAEAKKQQQKAEQQKIRNAEAAACAQGRERLQFLDSHPPNRLMQREPGGETRRITTEQWDQERAEAGKTIQDNCR